MKLSTYFYLTLFLLSGCFFETQQLPESKNHAFTKIPKKDRMDLAMEHEFQMTKDPETGEVPKFRLIAANEYRDRLVAEQLNSSSERSALSGIDWEERGPDNVAGRTRAILIDTTDGTYNTVFAGSVSGGLWKTTNFLSSPPTWTAVDNFLDNMAVTAIALDPTNTSHIYIGTGEGWYNTDATQGYGIFRSTDGGSTFSQFIGTDNPNFRNVQDLQFDTSGNLYAATRGGSSYGGVFKFTAGGSSWRQVLGSTVGAGATNRATDLELGADGSMYASLGIFSTGSVWKSDISNGVSTGNAGFWTDITPPTAGQRMEIAVSPDPTTADYIYVLIHTTAADNCGAIYQSTDGGTNWTSRTVPTIIDQGSNSNFTRGQAWYDLTAVVDPNDENTVYIGGIDALRTTDGGATWEQMTTWSLFAATGFTSSQNIHADHHSILYLPGSSSQMLIGTDGGIYYTANANVTAGSKPTFVSKNTDYNVTQFYACAIHPTSGTDYFLAGAQDNGSQQFSASGVNSTVEVSGGDGAFCHIDQDNASVQITSYVFNNYYISTNSFSSSSSYSIGSGAGKFINPTDYDDTENILYGSYNAGSYSYITGVGSSPTTGSRAIGTFGSSEPSAVTVSPNTSNRVFFGLDNGDVVRVDNAHDGTAAGTLIFDASAQTGITSLYVSSVAVEDGDDNHLLVTFSNFGVNSIYETTDGGSNWTSVEGNLPDMPVRWAMFSPESEDQVLIATDLGVWSTENLNGTSTEWGPSNSTLGNVRVDMLQHRTSDNTIIAATHGRGLFSTDAFTDPNINIEGTATLPESDADGSKSAPDACINYKDYTVNVQITKAPSSDADVTISVNGSSTATETEDFDLMTTSLTFTAAGSLLMPVTVRVYDDGFQESDETILLDITLTNGGSTDAQEGNTTQATLTIPGNESSPLSADSYAQLGTGSTTFNMPLRGSYSDARTQILYPATELIAQGLSAGWITGLAFDVASKGSSQAFQNFTITIHDAGLTDLDMLQDGGTTVYSQNFTSATGWNEFTFDDAYLWDGESNLLVEFCFDNASSTSADFVNTTTQDHICVWYFRDNGVSGCSLSTMQFTSVNRPNIRFYSGKKSDVATETTTSQAYIGPNETVNFYDGSGNILCTIANGTFDFGCTTIEIDRSVTSAGQDTVAFWTGDDDSKTLLAKTLKLTPTNNSTSASYNLTVYLTATEVSNWATQSGNSIGDIEMVKTANPIENTTPANPTAGGTSELVPTTVVAFGSDHAVTGSFTKGMSGVGFGIPGAPLAVEWLSFQGTNEGNIVRLDWVTGSEINNLGFVIERSSDRGIFEKIGFVNSKGNSTEKQKYSFTDESLVQQEKKYFYHLKQVDLDGKYDYSSIIEINLSQGLRPMLISPNPFMDQFSISIPVEINESFFLSLYSEDGKFIQDIYEGRWTGNPLLINHQLEALPAGIYLMKGSSEGKVFTEKIVKMK